MKLLVPEENAANAATPAENCWNARCWITKPKLVKKVCFYAQYQVLSSRKHIGESEDLTENSSDDGSASNLSNVSSGSDHSNGSRSLYLASLGSQAENLGFEAPINSVTRTAPFV
jgi:hypothetical protein